MERVAAAAEPAEPPRARHGVECSSPSGGRRARLDESAALLHDPRVVADGGAVLVLVRGGTSRRWRRRRRRRRGRGRGGRRPRAGEEGAPPRTNAPPRGVVVRPRRRGRRRDRWRRGASSSFRDRRRSRRRLRRRGARARAGGRARPRRPTTGRPIRDRARSRRRRPSARAADDDRGGARRHRRRRGRGGGERLGRDRHHLEGRVAGGGGRACGARGGGCAGRARRSSPKERGTCKKRLDETAAAFRVWFRGNSFSFATITPRAVVVTIRPFIGASSHRSARAMTTAAATASAPDAGADPAPASSQPRPAPRVVPHRRASRTRPLVARRTRPPRPASPRSRSPRRRVSSASSWGTSSAATTRAPPPRARRTRRPPPPSSEPTGTARPEAPSRARAVDGAGAAAPERTMMMSAVVASPMRPGENATGAPAPRRRGAPAALTPAKVAPSRRPRSKPPSTPLVDEPRRWTTTKRTPATPRTRRAREDSFRRRTSTPTPSAPPGSETGWSAADFREWCRLKMGAKDPSSGAEEDPSSSEDPPSAPSVVPCARWIVSGELYEYLAGALRARRGRRPRAVRRRARRRRRAPALAEDVRLPPPGHPRAPPARRAGQVPLSARRLPPRARRGKGRVRIIGRRRVGGRARSIRREGREDDDDDDGYSAASGRRGRSPRASAPTSLGARATRFARGGRRPARRRRTRSRAPCSWTS